MQLPAYSYEPKKKTFINGVLCVVFKNQGAES